ncbi:MAG: glycosyltransferase family 39 protein [Acidiphilium sp.]|nr:glycosyltransferase family 39 protein [Acidiphilium sp.]MDD4934302.1 glycosyltransferase family 39 protein [Acidiphilium sp.]
MRPGLLLVLLAALTALRLVVASLVPLAPDEAYYWLWSLHLQPGYYDDSPLIAYWIRAGTMVFGHSALGIRLLSPIGAAVGSILLWRAGEDLFPRHQAGAMAAILLNATLLLNAGAIITTPDTPLLLFWTATIAAVARWHATGDDRWWLAAGLAAGVALDAKYTGVLILLAIALWLLTQSSSRAALRRKLPWAGLALAIATFAPVIGWNAAHGWVSFIKQGGRTTHFDPADALGHLAGLIGGQIVLITPGVIALMSIGVWCAVRTRDSAVTLAWLTVLVPGAVFAEHTLSGAVQPNWPAVMIPGAALAAAGAASRITRRFLLPAVGLGAAMSALVYVQAIAAPVPLPVHRDPTALQLAGWRHLTADVVRMAELRHIGTIAASDYGLIAEIAHDAPPRFAVAGVGARWHYFARSRLAAGQKMVLIIPDDLPKPAAASFVGVTRLGSVSRTRNHAVIEAYHVYVVTFTGHVASAIMRPAR